MSNTLDATFRLLREHALKHKLSMTAKVMQELIEKAGLSGSCVEDAKETAAALGFWRMLCKNIDISASPEMMSTTAHVFYAVIATAHVRRSMPGMQKLAAKYCNTVAEVCGLCLGELEREKEKLALPSPRPKSRAQLKLVVNR